MPPDPWDPGQYARFSAERAAPFRDLLALVRPRPGMRVADLGCGSGELTAEAHRALGARETVGVDSSEAMLSRARALEGGGLSFRKGDLAAFDVSGFDLVLSNAALHWVPDHPALLARLTAALGPGAQLAVQVPANHGHPSQRVAREVAREPAFAADLADAARARERPVLEPEEYATLLFRLGWRERHVRLQVYGHPLASPEQVIEWVAGTVLTEYRRRLALWRWEAFLARYRERLLGAVARAPLPPHLPSNPLLGGAGPGGAGRRC